MTPSHASENRSEESFWNEAGETSRAPISRYCLTMIGTATSSFIPKLEQEGIGGTPWRPDCARVVTKPRATTLLNDSCDIMRTLVERHVACL